MKNKIIYALLSFVIALGLWFYVITVVSPESEETYYNIPVVLKNESVMHDKGLMITTEKEPTVTLRLRGNRSDLNNLKNSDISLIADLSKINDAGEQRVSFDTFFPGSFADNAFEVLSYSPDAVMLNVVERSTKPVDVVVEFTGNVPPDYIVYKDEYVLSHDKITITGPKSVVDQITHAQVNVDLENQIDSISSAYQYELCYETQEGADPLDLSLVTADVNAVDLSVKIQKVKEMQLLVNVVYGGGATEANTSIVYSEQTIKVSGNDKVLDSLGDTLVLDNINLAELLSDEIREYAIVLPEGVENLSGLDKVSVSISFSGLETKTLQVSKIGYYGEPSTLEVKNIDTKVCTVTLRGPKDQIKKIKAEHVQIRVNLENAVVGTELYKADVLVSSDFSAVGAVGNYTITVDVIAKPAA